MSLDAIFRPRAVAVVGASRKRGTIAAEVFHNLVTSGFAGAVYPVNPKAEVVQSVRAYADVEAIPDAVDLAVVVVPAAQVLEAVEACGRKGVRGVIVITAGFAEIGGEGRVRQEALVEVVRRYGMRLVGPNCLGVVNAELDVALNATFAPTFPPFGNVAFSSQSGALGLAILEVARDLGVGISQFVSMGNRADVSGNDLIEYWGEAAGTEVILLYLENLGNPARFMDIARKVSRKKPIVAVKSGRTEAGARAASSHTGSLAGMDVAVDALLGQAGVIRTDTIDELFDVAMLLANQPVPRGRRVGIVTNAGGPGIMATDALASRGLEVVRLRDETQARLATFLPPEASVKNPIDMIASATAQQYDRALSELVASDEVDAILVLFVTPIVTEARDVAEAIVRAATRSDKTILTCFMGRHGVPEAVSSLRAKDVPSYAFPESAAAALAKAVRYGEWLASPEGVVPTLEGIDAPRARRAVAGAAASRWLSPDEVRELLAAYGISMPRSSVVTSAAEAAERAAHVGLPMALKLVSDTITHKSDVGGVVLGITSADEARRAYAELRGRLEALGRGAEMQGALLQQMVPPGVETFVGATRDADFGHLIGFGIGGVHVELWKDIVFRVAPLKDVDAQAMLGQVRARALLDGFRGAPSVDKDAVVDVLLRVSRLVHDLPEIAELDINPLTAHPRGVVAVDARVRVAPR
ncbi:MAG: acetate--CoA ligase family protein [Polyangiaceae bacterium]|nr:acetate--CoA ligase family protein [Polyangiaceae bacterium]